MAVNEALTTCTNPIVGGRKTFPFIIAAVGSVGIAAYSVIANSGIYLIEQYYVSPVDASVIASIVTGLTNFAPTIGGIISDTCLSCFTVITIACAATSLAMFLFTLTAIFPSLRPPPCTSGPCQGPTTWQMSILYMALSLITVGLGGTRFTGAALGAAQFEDGMGRDSFFSWYLVGMYIASLIGIVGIVYIQASLGWVLGFGLCTAIAAVGLVIFLFGDRFYRHPKPDQNNPLVDVFRKIIWPEKRKGMDSSESLLHRNKLETIECLRASEEATPPKPEQYDDLTTLLRLVPLIMTGTVLSVYLSLQLSASFLQALVMDLSLTPTFTIPVGSVPVFLILVAAISLPLIDNLLYPLQRSLTGHPPTCLARIGLGFLVTTLAMVYGALTEQKRLHYLQTDTQPMSVIWLVPLFSLVGFGEALHFPGQLAFFYQEFPESLKSSGMAVSAFQSGIGSFSTAAVIGLVRRFSDGWIEDNANESRLDKMYWMLAGVGVLNFACFVAFARLYKKKQGGES